MTTSTQAHQDRLNDSKARIDRFFQAIVFNTVYLIMTQAEKHGIEASAVKEVLPKQVISTASPFGEHYDMLRNIMMTSKAFKETVQCVLKQNDIEINHATLGTRKMNGFELFSLLNKLMHLEQDQKRLAADNTKIRKLEKLTNIDMRAVNSQLDVGDLNLERVNQHERILNQAERTLERLDRVHSKCEISTGLLLGMCSSASGLLSAVIFYLLLKQGDNLFKPQSEYEVYINLVGGTFAVLFLLASASAARDAFCRRSQVTTNILSTLLYWMPCVSPFSAPEDDDEENPLIRAANADYGTMVQP